MPSGNPNMNRTGPQRAGGTYNAGNNFGGGRGGGFGGAGVRNQTTGTFGLPSGGSLRSGYDPTSRSGAFNTRLNINDPAKMHPVDQSLGNPLTTQHLNELAAIGGPILGAIEPTGIMGMLMSGAFRPDRNIASAGRAVPGQPNPTGSGPGMLNQAPQQAASGGGGWLGGLLGGMFGGSGVGSGMGGGNPYMSMGGNGNGGGGYGRAPAPPPVPGMLPMGAQPGMQAPVPGRPRLPMPGRGY